MHLSHDINQTLSSAYCLELSIDFIHKYNKLCGNSRKLCGGGIRFSLLDRGGTICSLKGAMAHNFFCLLYFTCDFFLKKLILIFFLVTLKVLSCDYAVVVEILKINIKKIVEKYTWCRCNYAKSWKNSKILIYWI